MKEHVAFVLLNLSYASQYNIISFYLSAWKFYDFIFFTTK